MEPNALRIVRFGGGVLTPALLFALILVPNFAFRAVTLAIMLVLTAVVVTSGFCHVQARGCSADAARAEREEPEPVGAGRS